MKSPFCWWLFPQSTSGLLQGLVPCYFSLLLAMITCLTQLHSECAECASIFKVLVTQSCQILCDSMDCSQPGSSVRGILQARITGVGSPFPSPGDLPDPGIKPCSPELLEDSLQSEPPGKPLPSSKDLPLLYIVVSQSHS